MTNTARDAWAILGVPPNSPQEMVRAQYLRLVRKNHPDQYVGNPVERARREEILKQIIWAYQEIVQGRAQSRVSAPSRAPSRPRTQVNPRDLQCRAHGRWAVIYCTVCGTPLCSRCDEGLTGYCSAHRPRGRF